MSTMFELVDSLDEIIYQSCARSEENGSLRLAANCGKLKAVMASLPNTEENQKVLRDFIKMFSKEIAQ